MMHKLNIIDEELTLIGQEDYQIDGLLFLEFTTTKGIEYVDSLFTNSNNLLEIKVVLDEAERIYKNFCVYKQLQYTMSDTPIYRVTLEQNVHLAEALVQITQLQLVVCDLYEKSGGE